jgi:hypothetical protein
MTASHASRTLIFRCRPFLLVLGLVGCANGGTLDLSVAANPNNVLSAVATVSWPKTTTAASITVTAQASGGTAQSTPAITVTGSSDSTTVPILPLKQLTTYTLHATGKTSKGEALASKDVTFTTGKIPSGVLSYTIAAGGTPSAGYTLLAPQPYPGTTGPQYLPIVDKSGAPVWYYETSPICGGDFQQQPDGSFTIAVVDPEHSITGLNEPITVYRQIDVLGNTLKTWTAQNLPNAPTPVVITGTDSHDIRIQPNGDALLFGLVEKTMDLTQYGGQSNANVVGNVFERVTPDGTVSFSWNTFDHLDVANIDPAAATVSGPVVDFTHANAIDVTADGNYLLGFRDLSQLIKIDSKTGDIIWKLGGADGQFTFVNDSLGGFSCQHGGRELPNGDILMLDDGDGHQPKQSRAVEYKLDTTATPMTATLVWSSEDSPAMYTTILGYAQRIANGNTLITYGQTGRVQEVDATGKLLWDLTDPVIDQVDFGIYRAYRMDTIAPMALTGG